MAIEIVSFSINSMVIFHRFLYVYQRVLNWVYHINIYLVGGLEHEFYFPYIGNNHPN